MMPPAVADRLLRFVASPDVAECVAGDLAEEFRGIAERKGAIAARRWYRSQVLRSILPLVSIRLRSRDAAAVAALYLGCVTLPLVVLDRLWTYVHTQIPLRGSSGRSWELLVVNLLCAALSLFLGQRLHGGWAAPMVAAALAVALSSAALPIWYVCLMLALPAVFSAVSRQRERNRL